MKIKDSLSESSEMMSFVFWEAASTVLLMCSIFYLNRRSYLSWYEEVDGILFLRVLLCSAKGYN